MRYAFYAVVLAVLASCAAPPTTQEPASHGAPSLIEGDAATESRGSEPEFQTYDEAMAYVRSTYPGESIDTSRSSWITGAEYYEAESSGYLIIGMQGKDYIFSGVPPDVWEGFKDAPSLGHYYHEEIRGRYHFDLGSAGEDSDEDDEDDEDDE
jgi:hypothetical protein